MKEYWIIWTTPGKSEPKGHAYVRHNEVMWEVVTKARGGCAVDALIEHSNKFKKAILLRILPVDEYPTLESALTAPKKGVTGW